MADSLSKDIELFDVNFEYVVYPCYQIKIHKETSEVEILRNKKSLKKFKQSSFPDVDFSSVDDVAKVLSIVREEGCVGLMTKYGISE